MIFSRIAPVLQRTACRGHKNFVMSEALAQIERECERYCKVPRIPPHKVCVVGAGSGAGRIAALLLKQQRIVKKLTMYELEPARHVICSGRDLASIDTSTALEAYQGRLYLRAAIEDADVVLICGDSLVNCSLCERDIFLHNMQSVRMATLAAAEFAPNAIIAVQAPPVDSNFAFVAYTLKTMGRYDQRRVLGVNAINSMRANQLICSITGGDPVGTSCPVVCGTGRCSRVPVFSSVKAASGIPSQQLECLTKLVRDADEIICKVKGNNEEGHLSIGFATARFVTNIMKGLFESSAYIDSALVEQGEPEKSYGMKYCASPVSIGRQGIEAFVIPQLSPFEQDLLEKSKCDFEDFFHLGRCYAVGEEYNLHPCKWPAPCKPGPDCPLAKPCEAKD